MKNVFVIIIVFLCQLLKIVNAMSLDFKETKDGLIVAQSYENNSDSDTTILYLLKNEKFKEVIEKLKAKPELGYNPENIDENRDTALLIAISKLDDFSEKDFIELSIKSKKIQEIINLILSNEIKPDFRFSGGHQGQTPLQRAVAQNLPTIVELLLNAGSPAHTIDFYQRTPLHVGAKNSCIKIVEMLVNAIKKTKLLIAVLNQKDVYGRSVISYATFNKHCKEKILKYFLEILRQLNEPTIEDLKSEIEEELFVQQLFF